MNGVVVGLASIYLFINTCETKIVQAILQGPGINKLGEFPGIMAFYTNDLPYYEDVEYEAFPGPTNRGDLVLRNENGDTEKRFFVHSFSEENLINIIEDHGFKRLKHKKKRPIDILNEEVWNLMPEYPKKTSDKEDL